MRTLFPAVPIAIGIADFAEEYQALDLRENPLQEIRITFSGKYSRTAITAEGHSEHNVF